MNYWPHFLKYWFRFIKYLWGKKGAGRSCEIILWSATQSPTRSIMVTANLPVGCANSIPTSVLPWQNSDPSHPPSPSGSWAILGLPEVCETMFSPCFWDVERPPSQGRNVKAATQMLLLQWGRQSLLSLLSLKLQHNLSDLCVEQHYVPFHCVQTFLLLKMLQFTEQLVLKATIFCISSV